MITQIHYKNFKALRDTTLPLGRFTLIVGANGTGKTTATRALYAVKYRDEFDYEQLRSKNLNGVGNNSVQILIKTELGELEEEWSPPPVGSTQYKGREFHLELDESVDSMLKTENVERLIREQLVSYQIYNFDAESISKPVQVEAELELDSDGKNLAGVLDQLRDFDPESFEELNSELNRWFPEYDRILFETPDKGVKSFLLRTKLGKHKIKASDLSHGTRLGLAYLTVAYLPNPPKIVCFEEPERGIHPRLLRNIQEAMDRLAYPENYGEKREPVQVIATTHSPYLLDLYKDRREEIVIADKDDKGVHFNRLTDLPNIEKILQEQDAPLGDIWFSGVLGGIPVQP